MNDLSINLTKTVQRKLALDSYFRQNVLRAINSSARSFRRAGNHTWASSLRGSCTMWAAIMMCPLYDIPCGLWWLVRNTGMVPAGSRWKTAAGWCWNRLACGRPSPAETRTCGAPPARCDCYLAFHWGVSMRRSSLKTREGKRFHMFDAFALVNYLLCSVISADQGRRGESTTTMRRNCLAHFREVI